MSSYHPRRPALRTANPDSTTDNRDAHKNVHFLDEYPVTHERNPLAYSYSPSNLSRLGGAEPLWRSEHKDWLFAGERERVRPEERGALRRHPADSPIVNQERSWETLQRANETPSLAYTNPIREDIPHPYPFRGDSPVLPLESVKITTRPKMSPDDFEDQEDKTPSYGWDEDDGQKHGQVGRSSDDEFRATVRKATSRGTLRKLQKPLPPIPGKDPPSTDLPFIESRSSPIPEQPPCLGTFDFEEKFDLFGSESSQPSQKLPTSILKSGLLSRSPAGEDRSRLEKKLYTPAAENRPRLEKKLYTPAAENRPLLEKKLYTPAEENRPLFEKKPYTPPESVDSEETQLRLGLTEENRPLLHSGKQAGQYKKGISHKKSEDLGRYLPVYKESSTQTYEFFDTPRRRSDDDIAPRQRYKSHGVQATRDTHPLNHLRVAIDSRSQTDHHSNQTFGDPPYPSEDPGRFHTYQIDQPHRTSQLRGVGAPYGIPATPAQQFSTAPSHSPPDHSFNTSGPGHRKESRSPPMDPPHTVRRRRKSTTAMDYQSTGYPEQPDQQHSSTPEPANARTGPYGVAGFQALSSTGLANPPLRPRKSSVSTTEASPPTPPDDVRSLASDGSDNPFSDRHRTTNCHGRKHRKQHKPPRPKASRNQLKVPRELSEEVDTTCSNPEGKMWTKMKRWGAGLKHKLKKPKDSKEAETT